MKEINLRWGLLAYFLLPYAFFLYFFRSSVELNLTDIVWALRNSLFQSTVAAAITLLLAVPFSLGLLSVSEKKRPLITLLLLIPQIMPSLFTLLIVFSIINPFPMGATGIIIVFVTVNLGFATVLLHQAAREKLGNFATVAEVFGLGRLKFFTKVYLPILLSDLRSIFFLIFVFCISSFSIPLIAGGGKGTNLEVLIYEKIFIEQNWAAAFSVCVFQTLFVFILSYFLVHNPNRSQGKFTDSAFLKSKTGLIGLVLYLSIYLGGYIAGLFQSFDQLDFLKKYSDDLGVVTLFSLQALTLYIILNVCLLLLWLSDYLKHKSFNPARNLISVSTVVVGFSVYLVFPVSARYDVIKMLLAMTVIVFPATFKLFLQKPVENLHRQLLVAEVFGLSKFTVIGQVIVRQLKNPLLLWLSVLVLWFLSDYAILKAVGVQSQTLGLLSESYLSSYRLPLSYLVSLYIILLSVLFVSTVYLLIKGLHVVYKKSAF